VGHGPLYQGRFKSYPVQSDEHALTVLRYVERIALGAGLVDRAEQWRWGGLWARRHGDGAIKGILSPWPVERPKDWLRRVNTPSNAKELRRLRMSIERGQPYGEEGWVKRTAIALGLEHTIRPQGRPPKRSGPSVGSKN
jgi:putative transposase